MQLRSTDALASYIYTQLQLHRYNDLLAFELSEASSGESMEIVFSLHEFVAKALDFPAPKDLEVFFCVHP